MNKFDDFLATKIKKDKIDVELDNAKFNQLHYMVNLNSARSEVKKSSVIGFLSGFMNTKLIAVKIAVVAVLFVLVIGNKDNRKHNSFIFYCDSTYINKNIYDTIHTYNNQISDSLYY